MSEEEEKDKVASFGVIVADLKQHMADLQELILDFEVFMQGHYPYTYSIDPTCILMHERINQLGVVRWGERHE